MRPTSASRRAKRSKAKWQPKTRTFQLTMTSHQIKPVPAVRTWFMHPFRLLSVVTLIGAFALVTMAIVSGRLRVYTAEIRGNHVVSSADIYRASGLDGLNIFQIDRAATEAAIVRALPNVRKATVRTWLPAGVSITVQEREPVAVWESGNVRYAVDIEGMVISTESVPAGTPLIRAADGRPIQPGERVSEAAVRMAKQLHALRPDVSTLMYHPERGVGFMTPQGWPVWFGIQPDDLATRVTTAVVLSRQLESERVRVEFIDLRFKQPYYRAK